MANWKRKLDISVEWQKADKDEITVQELAQVIANKLTDLPDFPDEEEINLEKEDIIEAFIDLSEDKNATTDSFDSLMEELYNWGDNNLDDNWPPTKVCWIGTF